MTRVEIEKAFKNLQSDIISSIELADGKGQFRTDVWEHHSGGGGISRVITDGNIIEKGGVNFSSVEGELSEIAAKALELPSSIYFATGVSIVLHPISPMVPIIHMNVRYFETESGQYWFGGGIDLTPHYINEEDARYFHQQLKDVCDDADPQFYNEFKNWADRYFYLPHRNETRGIGGIFFDRLNENSCNLSKAQIAKFVLRVGQIFAPTYVHLMKKNASIPFSERQSRFQALRRGRYVEFNLAFDRGTKFGLETGGRTESILMSLPANASWEYNYQAEEGSDEKKTLLLLKQGLNWLE